MKRIFTLLGLVLLMYTGVQAQNRVLSGKVTGADDSQPIIGVNVLLKGTTTGAVTEIGRAHV